MFRWRYLLIVLVLAACSGPTPTGPTPGPPPDPPPPPPPNNAPQIISVTANSLRAEVGEEITLVAVVSDDETAPEDLRYEWSATSGTINGSGSSVKWTAPTGPDAPGTHTLSLTVVEPYVSGTENKEHRVSQDAPPILVEDSEASISALVLQFLYDFTHPEISPEMCVRNFSDSCRGKLSELSDIRDNRRRVTILPSRSSYSISHVAINPSRTQANVTARCRFTSIVKIADPRLGQPGDITVATGDCLLTAIYENQTWRLCDSNFRGSNLSSLYFPF